MPELLERRAELDALHDAVGDACAGRGRVVLVHGPAGIGKTRLLAEARAVAAGRQVPVLAARGGELERDFAFGVARQLLEPALHGLTPATRAVALVGAAGLAGPVVGRGDDPPAQMPLVGDRLFSVVHGLFWLTCNLVGDDPLVLAVDDVQWADEPSLHWLAYLARRVEGLPVLLVLAARDEAGVDRPAALAELAGDRATTVLRPEPLSPDAAALLVAGVLGADPAPEVRSALQDRGAGNPFVLRELAEAVRGAGIDPTDPAQRSRVAELLPDSVTRAVVSRLTRLPDAAVALARAAAVLGSHVHLGDAARVADLSERDAAEAMDVLVDAGLLLPESPLAFAHPLMREAIYGDLPIGRRTLEHRRAADVLLRRIEPERIAAHLLQCDPRGDQESVSVLRRCAMRATEHGAPATAVRYLERALDEPPRPEDRGVLLRELGTVEARVGDPRAVEHLEEALRVAASPAEVAAASRELAVALAARGGMDEAAAALERGIELLDGRDREMELRLEGELGAHGQLHVGSAARAAQRLQRVAPALAGDTPGERLVLASYAHLRSTQFAPPDELVDIAERAVAGGALLREQTADSPVLYLLIYAFFRAERPDRSDHWLGAALDEARARGSLLGTSIALAVRAQLSWLRGALASAEADAQTSVDAQLEAGWASVLPLALAVLAECRLERGDPAGAAGLFEDHGLGGPLPDMVMFRWAQASRGRARLAAGRADDGLEDLLACGGGTGARHDVALSWRADAALALHARGDAEGASRLAEEQLELAAAAGVARPLGVALRTAGLLASGDEQERLLAEAVGTLEGSNARLEHARALVDLGAAVRRARRRGEARQPLQEGFELARRCGSVALADRAVEELEAAGVRLRRPALRGTDALTPSERRVAEMASTGMSNPEIAQALFVTRKTIEMHLGHVYRKLEVSGRDRLAEALAQAPQGKDWGASPLSDPAART